jgi:hypothetical protein
VSLLHVLAIVVVADLVAIAALLWMRRAVPQGMFGESAHPGAVLQTAGTVFAVMVGFVFLIAFQSYNDARTQAQREATATESLATTAALLPSEVRGELQGDLLCYARSVIHHEWPRMIDEREPSPVTDRWVEHMAADFAAIRPRGLIDGTAGYNWLAQTDARQSAREERLDEARPLVPMAIWVLLILSAVGLVAFVLSLATKRERALAEALMVAVVTTLVVSGLVTIAFLDRTYGDFRGAVEPAGMENAEVLVARERERSSQPLPPAPCDPTGLPRGAVD